mmetsp:Transcript_11472/g.39998  ORF Transcript_11472/g.39998 Transcript_11472/m.39998 type:complete len:676 (-) Transcript_11472:1171-3198(-)
MCCIPCASDTPIGRRTSASRSKVNLKPNTKKTHQHTAPNVLIRAPRRAIAAVASPASKLQSQRRRKPRTQSVKPHSLQSVFLVLAVLRQHLSKLTGVNGTVSVSVGLAHDGQHVVVRETLSQRRERFLQLAGGHLAAPVAVDDAEDRLVHLLFARLLAFGILQRHPLDELVEGDAAAAVDVDLSHDSTRRRRRLLRHAQRHQHGAQLLLLHRACAVLVKQLEHAAQLALAPTATCRVRVAVNVHGRLAAAGRATGRVGKLAGVRLHRRDHAQRPHGARRALLKQHGADNLALRHELDARCNDVGGNDPRHHAVGADDWEEREAGHEGAALPVAVGAARPRKHHADRGKVQRAEQHDRADDVQHEVGAVTVEPEELLVWVGRAAEQLGCRARPHQLAGHRLCCRVWRHEAPVRSSDGSMTVRRAHRLLAARRRACRAGAGAGAAARVAAVPAEPVVGADVDVEVRARSHQLHLVVTGSLLRRPAATRRQAQRRARRRGRRAVQAVLAVLEQRRLQLGLDAARQRHLACAAVCCPRGAPPAARARDTAAGRRHAAASRATTATTTRAARRAARSDTAVGVGPRPLVREELDDHARDGGRGREAHVRRTAQQHRARQLGAHDVELAVGGEHERHEKIARREQHPLEDGGADERVDEPEHDDHHLHRQPRGDGQVHDLS